MPAEYFPPPTTGIRLHLDECVHPSVAPLLRDAGIDVTDTLVAGLLAEADEAQLRFCYETGRTLVTHDRLIPDKQYEGDSKPPVIFIPHSRHGTPESLAGLILETLSRIAAHAAELRPYPESVTKERISKRIKNRRRRKARRKHRHARSKSPLHTS